VTWAKARALVQPLTSSERLEVLGVITSSTPAGDLATVLDNTLGAHERDALFEPWKRVGYLDAIREITEWVKDRIKKEDES